MSQYLDEALRLRAIVEPHYNCCQSVVMAFAPAAGLDTETARSLCVNLGGGLKRDNAVCGAVLGGLIVLGLFGVNEPEVLKDYYIRIGERHEHLFNCADLLGRKKPESKAEKKVFCDGLVEECTLLTESILREKGKL